MKIIKLKNGQKLSSESVDNRFSTAETVVGTWIDGKLIYRKVVKITVGNTFQTWIDNLTDVDTFIKVSGYIKYDKGFHQLGAYANENFYSLIQFNKELQQVYLYTKANSGYSGKEACVIMEYTKNTE